MAMSGTTATQQTAAQQAAVQQTAAEHTAPEGHQSAHATHSTVWMIDAMATATLLFAAWYIFGKLIALGIIPDDVVRERGDSMIMPMLIGVFYLASGYLFQAQAPVRTTTQWWSFFKPKIIVQLTPFFAFTILMMLTGTVSSMLPALVNHGIVSSLPTLSWHNFVQAVFVQPINPLGYFVVVLVFYLITRTPQTTKGMVELLVVAGVVKVGAILLTDFGLSSATPYYLFHVMDKWIWFVIGMALAFFHMEAKLANGKLAIGAWVVYLAWFITLVVTKVNEATCLTLLCTVGLLAYYSTFASILYDRPQVKFYGWLTQFTMAIWLMHPILGELCCCALFALGLSWVGVGGKLIYLIVCMIACYLLPEAVMTLLNHVWKLGFIVYPARYLPKK